MALYHHFSKRMGQPHPDFHGSMGFQHIPGKISKFMRRRYRQNRILNIQRKKQLLCLSSMMTSSDPLCAETEPPAMKSTGKSSFPGCSFSTHFSVLIISKSKIPSLSSDQCYPFPNQTSQSFRKKDTP